MAAAQERQEFRARFNGLMLEGARKKLAEQSREYDCGRCAHRNCFDCPLNCARLLVEFFEQRSGSVH